MVTPRNKVLIKICGIQTAELAYQAVLAGADFIGIMFHPQSKRYVNLKEAQIISCIVRKHGAIPVAIFVHHSAQQMQNICISTQIDAVQLHGNIAKEQHHKLPRHYQRLYVKSVSPNCIIDQNIDHTLTHCDPMRDYLLFDHVEPGIGQTFQWEALNYHGRFRLGIAGGLNAHNIVQAITYFQPAIVDVSTGVENKNGKKEIALIHNFVHTIHRYTKGINDEI
jgi:phosphoribosylanthranilate isomerase